MCDYGFPQLPVSDWKHQTLTIENTNPGNVVELKGVLEADTIFITDNVIVPGNEVLTFLPGTTVVATGFFGFDVRGSIRALGTASQPVVFTVSDTTGFSDPRNGRGGWDGFNFTNVDSGSDSSLFSYCIFRYTKAIGDSLTGMGGAFNIRHFDRIKISDCEFNHNQAYFWGGAIFVDSGNIQIQDCSFTGNFCGSSMPLSGYGGAVCIRNSVVDVVGCKFTQNSSSGIGGGISMEYADVLLQSCIFTGNSSGLGGALGYLRSKPLRPVVGNLFTGNSAIHFGGAASFNRAHPLFINNTVSDNLSHSYGGGIYCNDSAAPVLINNIIYSNLAYVGAQVYIWDIYSAPEFHFCNIEGGQAAFGGTGGIGFVAPYLNNIDTLPGYNDFSPHPYSLTQDSPCINKGNPDTTGMMLPKYDLAGNPRVHAGRIDIGAYESDAGTFGVDQPNGELSFSCHPNPFDQEVVFTLPRDKKEAFNIQIVNARGQEVLALCGIYSDKFTWTPGKEHKRGIYYVVVTCGNDRAVSRIVSIR